MAVASAGCGMIRAEGGWDPGSWFHSREPRYEAEIRWTSGGIPHVRADDWAGLGYGHGYAVAQDNVCVLAEEFVTARGERSLFFGPGETHPAVGGLLGSVTNLDSDAFYRWASRPEVLESLRDSLRPELRDLLRGYAAGYNRHLRETEAEGLPEACRGAAWVRPISPTDLLRRIYKFTLLGGAAGFAAAIVRADPPPGGARTDGAERPSPGLRNLGSNAWAFGRDVTRSGRGILLGNPHFPWIGPERFYQVHLTIPGKVDVLGGAIYGVPLVLIGFTESFAWTHTVSAAHRFTAYELDLAPDDPSVYLVDGERRSMERREVRVPVSGPDGSVEHRSKAIWTSHYGPVFVRGESFPWTNRKAYALRDANSRNFRVLEQFYRIDTAPDLESFRRSLKTVLGLPWVNTVAVDAEGTVFYGDVSVTPHVSDERIERCILGSRRGMVLEPWRVPVLNGADSRCEWAVDPATPDPGLLPPDELPVLERTDFVANSNDSFWLTNPAEPLEGFPAILGTERTARSLRTRAGLVLIEDRLAGRDALPGNLFDTESVETILFSNRHYGAEILLDDLLEACPGHRRVVVGADVFVDLERACRVLDEWDRRVDRDSRGAHVFREFWFRARDVQDLYREPFDPNDPVHTPRGLNVGNPAVWQALALAVEALREADVPLDAPLGDVQFVRRGEERIPLHGGFGSGGVFNVIEGPDPDDQRTPPVPRPGIGYAPVVFGTSYVQVVTFDDEGPVADTIVAYAQSTDPTSPHAADQTRLYSRKEWVRVPFHEEAIRRDPALEVRTISE